MTRVFLGIHFDNFDNFDNYETIIRPLPSRAARLVCVLHFILLFALLIMTTRAHANQTQISDGLDVRALSTDFTVQAPSVWRDPERTMVRLFPEARYYKTEVYNLEQAQIDRTEALASRAARHLYLHDGRITEDIVYTKQRRPYDGRHFHQTRAAFQQTS